MIKELYNALFTDDNILLFNRDSCNITFSSDVMGILSIDLNNIMMLVLDLWLSTRYKQTINASSIASNKMIGLVLARR